jgi:hypothetical protein
VLLTPAVNDKLSLVSMLPAINISHCVVTGEKFLAGVMKYMKTREKVNTTGN